MTINELIDLQAEVLRLQGIVEELRKTGNDPLRLKYLKSELEYYKTLVNKQSAHDDCVRSARISEIARLRADRETWEQALLSPCHKERAFAGDKIEAINSAISLIQSFL